MRYSSLDQSKGPYSDQDLRIFAVNTAVTAMSYLGAEGFPEDIPANARALYLFLSGQDPAIGETYMDISEQEAAKVIRLHGH